AMLTRIREAADHFAPMPLGSCLEVDTSRPVDLESLTERLLVELRQPADGCQ
ncbi:MAG: hypothetical protein QOK15_3486, partial [Nocardioidaceae bacterium]|nr:hypothetical protein [Nocardioidaceae bacterium]